MPGVGLGLPEDPVPFIKLVLEAGSNGNGEYDGGHGFIGCSTGDSCYWYGDACLC